MRGRFRVAADAELRLRQHRERLTIQVVEQPRFPDEQRSGVLEPVGVDLRLRALDDQKRIGIGVAPGGGEQGLGGMPRPPRQPERVGAVGGGVVGWNVGLGAAQRRQQQLPRERRNPDGAGPSHRRDCLNRISAR